MRLPEAVVVCADDPSLGDVVAHVLVRHGIAVHPQACVVLHVRARSIAVLARGEVQVRLERPYWEHEVVAALRDVFAADETRLAAK